jgi:hypothetical protein
MSNRKNANEFLSAATNAAASVRARVRRVNDRARHVVIIVCVHIRWRRQSKKSRAKNLIPAAVANVVNCVHRVLCPACGSVNIMRAYLLAPNHVRGRRVHSRVDGDSPVPPTQQSTIVSGCAANRVRNTQRTKRRRQNA